MSERSPRATTGSFETCFNIPNAKIIRKLFAKYELNVSVDDTRVDNIPPRQTVATTGNVGKVSGIAQRNPQNNVQ